MTTLTPSEPAPPQPPLPEAGPPPVVDGIEDIPDESSPVPPKSPPQCTASSSEELVRPGDLAAFVELFSRFHSRVEKAAAGRKYRPLRDAFDAAASEMSRHTDRIDLSATSALVVDALRSGCDSGKIVVVDACLDCIHRLFEYGHIGSCDSTDVALDVHDGVLDDLVAMVCACLEVKDEDVYLRMVQTLLTAATRTRSGLHQGTLLAAVRTIYNIFLNARMLGTRTTARVSLTQILNLVFARMEAETAEDSVSSATFQREEPNHHDSAVDVPKPAAPAEEGDDASEFTSILQKDAYLLFRALCKLSAKEAVDTAGPEPVGIRSKLLSLQLIRNLIGNSGPAFRSGERFVYALRQYLSPSLLVNCTWNSPEVMDVSFDIFEMLLRKDTLRPLLKTEIGALFDTVIFRFLESPTAGPMRKRRAMALLSRLSSDRQSMADLFLNYDCDMESPKVFERIVNAVSAAAQDKSYAAIQSASNGSATGTGQNDVRTMAMTSVTLIVRSLREWSKPIEEGKDQDKTIALGSSETYPLPGEAGDASSKKIPELVSPVSVDSEILQGGDSALKGSDGRLKSTTSNLPVVGTVSEGNDRDTSRFEEALKAKKDTAEGVKMFNTKPKRGIAFLVENGRLEKDPLAVARFLHKAENLDAVMVGEFLGEGGTFNVNVMHAYTDMRDFTDLAFDAALRLHLSGFRLPGEAQKIDRIMEKYASRYCECNPDVFANADAAYVLAYSTIMLHTDAHNDTIKHKMSKEEFIRNNRGINDGGDLDPKFLGMLYDRITTAEIRLTSTKRDSSSGGNVKSLNAAVSAMDPVQKARQFEQESQRLMSQTKVLFAKKRRPAQDYTYYSATNVHHARLMFETAWFPVLAAVSLNLEESSPSDTTAITLCLDGFRNGIAIASTFGMSTAKDAFVSSLSKFTHLSSIAEMRPKNVECVRMILAIAALEGNNLGEQWVVIVRAISQLEQIRAVATGNPGKHLLQKGPLLGIAGNAKSEGNAGTGNGFLRTLGPNSPSSDGNSQRSGSSGTNFRRTSSAKSTSTSDSFLSKGKGDMRPIDSKAASIATTIAEGEIERIFTKSVTLSASGVADFCGALCTVSLEELSEKPTPRLFCLQKIVEMAYYNMESRTRLQWGKIWSQMGPFFGSAMCHVNRDVAMYAIDALRQLASKFLDKDELSNFSFQRSFLKPFEICFSGSKNVQVRELVLTCVSQIVLARAANIKSGWKSVFGVLALAADDKVESIMSFGWQIVDSIASTYIGVLDDVFVDSVTGISAYAKASVSTPVSLAAIGLLSGVCAKSLADGNALSVVGDMNEAKSTRKAVKVGNESGECDEKEKVWFTADCDAHIGAWFPILTGLASAMQDERSAVRIAANDGLYLVLREHGGQFAPSLWALVFRGVLSPIFDDVKYLSSSVDGMEAASIIEWATTTGSASLKALVDVFVQHLDVTRSLLGDLVELIRSWVVQEAEVVAREGMSILVRLVMLSGETLMEEDWKIIVKGLHRMFVETMPHEIVGPGKQKLREENGVVILRENEVIRPENGEGDVTKTGEGGSKEGSVIEENGAAEAEEDKEEEREVEKKKIDFRVVRAKCVVQLLLIELVQELVVSFYRILSTEDIVGMSKCLETSYMFAHDFNADVELRYSLWRSGFMNQVPNLLKQETNGLMAYLRIVFWMYLDDKRKDHGGYSEEKVMQLCGEVLHGYIESCSEGEGKGEDRPREIVALSPVVCFIVNGMMQMSDEQFDGHLNRLYDVLLDVLDGANEAEVRQSVTKLFRARIRPTTMVTAAGSSDCVRKGMCDVGIAQIPGAMRERMVRARLGAQAGSQAEAEIRMALNRVGGVRSVVAERGEGVFRVACSAPDEMLTSSLSVLKFVKNVSVEAVSNIAEID